MKVVTEGTQEKKKKYNKNKKKAWRKKADISEIEAILDDVRREERFGGPLDEREDEELMFLDTGDYETGIGRETEDGKDEAVKLDFQLDTTPGSSTSKKKEVQGFKPSKQPEVQDPIKAFRFIDGLQGAKVPIKPRMKSGVVTKATERKIKRLAENPKVASKFQNKVEDIRSGMIRSHHVKMTDFKSKRRKNIWEETDDLIKECHDKGLDEEYMNKIWRYYKTHTKKGQPVQIPSHRLKKPSALPAVPLPKAGISYHPTFDDHQEALQEAVHRIKRLRKIERNDAKFDPAKFKKRLVAVDNTWAEELAEGLTLRNGKVHYAGNVQEKQNEQKNGNIEKKAKGKKSEKKKVDLSIVKKEEKEDKFDVSIVKKEEDTDNDEEDEAMQDDYDEEDEAVQDDLEEEEEEEDEAVQDDLEEEEEEEAVQDDLEEEDEAVQDDLEEEDEAVQDDLKEEDNSVENEEMDSEKENKPKQKIKPKRKKAPKTEVKKVTVNASVLKKDATKVTKKGKNTKNVQEEKVNQNQEIQKAEVITVSALQKGQIRPKRKRGGNRKKDTAKTEQVEDVQDTKTKPKKGLKKKAALENKENVEVQSKKGKKRKKADSDKTNSVKVKKTKAVQDREAKPKKELRKKAGVESKKNVAIQKTEEVKEENTDVDKVDSAEVKKEEEVTWKKTRRGKKKKKSEKEDDQPVVKKISQRKTEKQRKLERVKKYKKCIWEKRINERDREARVELVPTYLETMRNRMLKNRARRERKKQANKEKRFRTRRLGPAKFLDEDMTVCDGDKLPGSIRRVRPVGNLFLERVKHLQRRNMIAPGADMNYGTKKNLKKGIRRSNREDKTMKSVYDD
ncbi:ribosome biogenesis protein NOP53-like isoform X2 [Penaeus japonicus]|uniref:ribosome biogenesis protein NOP53-like isoform X2 n=1 Tax=Penaeus japonicus TaxID=27405 RepID=UPI001C70D324|nr:ribosome biogenesis protein NOP53-like isoform X2 [Penaeus japonicus]